MEEPTPNSDMLKEFARERSIRRILRVLRAKRSRMNEDLKQLVTHLGLLIPLQNDSLDGDIVLEALERLEEDGFSNLLEGIIKNPCKGDK